MMENERKGECEREIHGQQQYKPNAQEKWKMAAWGFKAQNIEMTLLSANFKCLLKLPLSNYESQKNTHIWVGHIEGINPFLF